MDSRKEEENPVSAAQPPNSDCELTLRRRARAAEGPDVGAWSRAASVGAGPHSGPAPPRRWPRARHPHFAAELWSAPAERR